MTRWKQEQGNGLDINDAVIYDYNYNIIQLPK